MDQFKKNRPSATAGIIEKKFGRIMRNMSFPAKNASYFSAWEPAVDIYQSEKELVLYIDVSGVPVDEVELIVEEKRLVLSGKRQCVVTEITKVHQLENEYGPFERIVELPVLVVISSMRAQNSNGFLVVRLALS